MSRGNVSYKSDIREAYSFPPLESSISAPKQFSLPTAILNFSGLAFTHHQLVLVSTYCGLWALIIWSSVVLMISQCTHANSGIRFLVCCDYRVYLAGSYISILGKRSDFEVDRSRGVAKPVPRSS